MSDAGIEFKAIQAVHGALEPLEVEARIRVLAYIASLLGIDTGVVGGRAALGQSDPDEDADTTDVGKASKQTPNFPSFADLYAAASPKSNGEKALVAGYWLQKCQGAENFTGAAVQKELTHLGHKLPNVTDAINQMKSRKPMLILQLKKSGASKQARKLYKITHEGEQHVEEVISG